MSKKQTTKEWFEIAIGEVLDDLYGAALRLAKNPADAEDLVGECVVKAFKNLDSLNDKAAFRGWVFKIMSNCFISECRKRKIRPEISFDAQDAENENEQFWLFDKLHQPFLLWWGNPEQHFINGLLREDLTRAVDELPEYFRIVLILAELEGFTYQEISTMLEIPVGTVRSRLSRARTLLQKTLWEHAPNQRLQKEQAKEKHEREII